MSKLSNSYSYFRHMFRAICSVYAVRTQTSYVIRTDLVQMKRVVPAALPDTP